MIKNLLSWLPIVIFGSLIMVGGCDGSGSSSSSIDKNTSMIKNYVREMNNGNSSYLDEYMDTGYIYHGPQGDLTADEFKKRHNMLMSAFPHGTMTADDIIASGDKVITRWTFHGKQSGEFNGIAPTGKVVVVSGIIITRFQNGKAVEEWEEMNQLGMMQQLGAVPTPESTNQ